MKAKKLLSLLLAATLILSLAACGTNGGNNNDTKTVSNTDYEVDTTFNFTNSGITADGSDSGYEINGTALTIISSGTYALTGSCSDGSVTVKKGTAGVTLVLNGIDLTSADTAPITCSKSTEVTVIAADGTENSLADSSTNNGDENPDNENAENAVIKCKDGSQVTLCGGGSLSITANGKNGIKSGTSTSVEGEASLTIKELSLSILAPLNDAINAEQLLNIESGTITIAAGDDAVHSDLVLNIGAQDTDGPSITITECYEGLEAAELNVISGDIDITSSDDCLNAANSDLSGYDFSMNISGGTISAYSSEGDGFDSNGDLNISGGTVAVWTANRADNQPLDADGTISVTGGTIFAAGGSSGMGFNISAEQAYVTFSSGGGMDSSALASSGSAVALKDSGGNELFSSDAPCSAAFVFFSSPELTDGQDVNLFSGSSETATASAQTGTSSTGNMGGGMSGMQPGGNMGDMQPPSGTPGGQKPDGEPPQGRPGSN